VLGELSGNPVAAMALTALILLTGAGLLAPVVAPRGVVAGNLADAGIPPVWMEGGSWELVLGTDAEGRDLLGITLHGLRLTLFMGLGAVLLQGVAGTGAGLLSGYAGGRVDALFMRATGIQLSFSPLMTAVLLCGAFMAVSGVDRYGDRAVPWLMAAVALAEWPRYGRAVRLRTLEERRKEYVEAARITGLDPGRILGRHILPNVAGSLPLLTAAQAANAVACEAVLSFLGLGMPASRPSLGRLVRSGFDRGFEDSWGVVFFPGLLLVLLLLALKALENAWRGEIRPRGLEP